MKLFKILILLVTVASARGAMVAGPFTTNTFSKTWAVVPSLTSIGTVASNAASGDAILLYGNHTISATNLNLTNLTILGNGNTVTVSYTNTDQLWLFDNVALRDVSFTNSTDKKSQYLTLIRGTNVQIINCDLYSHESTLGMDVVPTAPLPELRFDIRGVDSRFYTTTLSSTPGAGQGVNMSNNGQWDNCLFSISTVLAGPSLTLWVGGGGITNNFRNCVFIGSGGTNYCQGFYDQGQSSYTFQGCQFYFGPSDNPTVDNANEQFDAIFTATDVEGVGSQIAFNQCSFSLATPFLAQMTVTNPAGTANGNTIVVNGTTRIFTNSPNANNQITTGSNPLTAASNIWYSYNTLLPQSGVVVSLSYSNVVFSALTTNLTLSASGGWGSAYVQSNSTKTTIGHFIQQGDVSFNDCFYSPATNGVIIVNDLATVKVNGGNFAPANFSSPSNVIWGGSANATNVAVNSLVLAAASQQTNYTVPLLPGPAGNMLTIYTVNTNCFVTFTGTNNANWQRTVAFLALTNTVSANLAFAQATRTNSGLNTVVTNGWMKVVNFYNLDTTGTNVLTSDTGLYR